MKKQFVIPKIINFFIIISITFISCKTFSKEINKKSNKIIAIVNNEIITQNELDKKIIIEKHYIKNNKIFLENNKKLQSYILDKMIMELIQIQKIQEYGIIISDKEIDLKLKNIYQAKNMTLNSYRSYLSKINLSLNDIKKDIYINIAISKLRSQIIKNIITISSEEISNYILKLSRKGYNQNNEIRFKHILLKVPKNSNLKQIKNIYIKSKNILFKLLNGANFSKLAKSISQSSDASIGGDMGFLSIYNIPIEFLVIAPNLKIGQIYPDVIKTNKGFEIIQLIDYQRKYNNFLSDNSLSIIQTHVQHIILPVNKNKTDEIVYNEIINIKNKIKSNKYFKDFAYIYSQDESALAGGDLGIINPNDLHPEFENIMNRLHIREISNPVRTKDGYHLIQVLERKIFKGSLKEYINIAYKKIKKYKSKELYNDLLNYLRDISYIKYI